MLLVRLPMWIISVSQKASTCRKLQFVYGVFPVHEVQDPAEWSLYAREVLGRCGFTRNLAMRTKSDGSGLRDKTNQIEFIELDSSFQ